MYCELSNLKFLFKFSVISSLRFETLHDMAHFVHCHVKGHGNTHQQIRLTTVLPFPLSLDQFEQKIPDPNYLRDKGSSMALPGFPSSMRT